MKRDILVTGGRGKTGREVVRQLLDVPNVRVRSGTSRPSGGDAVAVAFDWHDRSTWREATAGVDAIYLVRPDLEEAPDLVAGLVDLASSAHVVLLSEQAPDALNRESWPARVERAVDGAASHTVLRPSWFNQVFTDPRFYLDSIRRERTLRLPAAGAPIAWIDSRDIAEVAVAALLEPVVHDRAVYTLTGPEALTVAETAAAIATAIGRPIRAEEPQLSQELEGLSPWLYEVLADMYGRVQAGHFGRVTTTVTEVTGRPARTLEAFLDENAALWRSPRTAGPNEKN